MTLITDGLSMLRRRAVALISISIAFSFSISTVTIQSIEQRITYNSIDNYSSKEYDGPDKKYSESHLKLFRSLGVHSSDSDVAFLHHCNLSELDNSNDGNDTISNSRKIYSNFRNSLWDHLNKASKSKGLGKTLLELNTTAQDLWDEVTLQSLELYARIAGLCNFSLYQPAVRISGTQWSTMARRISSLPTAQSVQESVSAMPTMTSTQQDVAQPTQVRIVYCISAYDDFAQLRSLVKAIHLPQHLIIIHLERRTQVEFTNQVHRELEERFPNVVVIQYGSITYPSDSLSQVFLEIMRTITLDMGSFQYDYWINLGSTSYPLYNAVDLASKLYREPKYVRIGVMLQSNPRKLCREKATSFGLTFSRGGMEQGKTMVSVTKTSAYKGLLQMLRTRTGHRGQFRGAGSEHSLDELIAFPGLQKICQWKSYSGNTAAFDRDAVVSILKSPKAMEVFSRFKLSGRCCNEESSWAAILTIVAREEDLLKPALMFQAWPCAIAMHNIQLKENNRTCMRLYDDQVMDGRKRRGIEGIRDELVGGRARGNLFARKLRSYDSYWMDWIQVNFLQLNNWTSTE